jgi:hypothetical protein
VSIFDLVFIGLFFGVLVYGGWIVGLLGLRRWATARRHAFRLGGTLGVYLLVVIAVGNALPRRVLEPAEYLRYDDWWIGVDQTAFAETMDVGVNPKPGHRFLIVTLEVRSRAGRVRQAAPAGALVYVVDKTGGRYDVSERGQAAFEKRNGAQLELTTPLEPNGSFHTTRVFEVPQSATELSLGHRHGSGSHFPGMFIIGQGFRPAAVIRLPR